MCVPSSWIQINRLKKEDLFRDYGSIDLLSHFTKVKCDSWTYFFCVVLVTQGIPATGVKHA